MPVLNEQKHNWAWDYRVFHLFSDGVIEEVPQLFRKGGYIHWAFPTYKGNSVMRIICKSKVDTVMTVCTGIIVYKK